MDSDGELRHPGAEVAVVLLGEDGSGAEHGHLAASGDGLEGSANGDLRFPKSNVAADEAVHRQRGLHVGLGGGDGAELVGGLGVGEGILEVPHPFGIWGVSVARDRLALGLNLKEAGGVVADRLLGLDAGLFPSLGAEFGEVGGGSAGADVAGDEVGMGESGTATEASSR